MFSEYTLTCLPDSGTTVERAHAKVNLLLRVGERRADGFHEIATVLQTVALHDRVTLTWAGIKKDGFADGFEVHVTSDDRTLPNGEQNLAVRAFRRLEAAMKRQGIRGGTVRIHIVKRIPVAAGLGGGSANAAAVLRATNRCFGLGLTTEELAEIGAGIGSDVPACVHGGTLFCQGRGEKVAAVSSGKVWWVLVSAGGALRAGDVYAALDEHFSGTVQHDPGRNALEDAFPGFTEAIAAADPSRLAPYLVNSLERPVGFLEPRTVDLVRRMKDMGVTAALVSGSGPTVAGLVADAVTAKTVARRLQPTVPWVWWGPSVDPDSPVQWSVAQTDRDEASS